MRKREKAVCNEFCGSVAELADMKDRVPQGAEVQALSHAQSHRNSGIRIMKLCRERDDKNGVKSVDGYCAMSMNKRLSDGFTNLSGKTAAHLSRYDARAKESLVAWQTKQTSYRTGTKQTQRTTNEDYGENFPPGDPCGSVHPNGPDGSVNFDFNDIIVPPDAPTFRDLFSEFFRRR